MKEILISILRDKKTDSVGFRNAADKLAEVLAFEVIENLEKKKVSIETPIHKTSGVKIKNNIVLVPILRAGLSLLPAFLKFLPEAKVGVLGLKRDEKTFEPKLYYKNFPKISKSDEVIILDPMLATGGSLSSAIEILKSLGIKEERIIFVGVVSAPEGLTRIKRQFPKVRMIIAVRDKKLNKQKYIVPGLGDFGDRYFGTI